MRLFLCDTPDMPVHPKSSPCLPCPQSPGVPCSANRRQAAASYRDGPRRKEAAFSGKEPSGRLALQAEEEALGQLSGEEGRWPRQHERLPDGAWFPFSVAPRLSGAQTQPPVCWRYDVTGRAGNDLFVFCHQNEVTLLRNEVAQLKQLLLAHKDCPVTIMQKKAAFLGNH